MKPWKVAKHNYGVRRVVSGNRVIAASITADTEEECKANAALIAAAPELLAACKRMLRAHNEGWNVAKMDFPPIDDIRAAIKKAEGTDGND